MIKLSERLELIASKVNIGESVADIGTDHGFLPIALWERGISEKVIMADISKGSLEKAVLNCRELYPDMEFDTRLGDGLAVLEKGETDCIVIAGMGGLLMIKMFEADMNKTLSFNKYILQPRISSGRLRHWLIHNGFSISDDNLVREGKFICNVITASTNQESDNIAKDYLSEDFLNLNAEDIKLDVPVWLKGESLFVPFVERRIRQEEDILKSMKSAGESWNERKTDIESGIDYLKELIK